MTQDQRALLQAWIDRVRSRPSAMCGVFVGEAGQPFGSRARPWDEPDLLISATVLADGIRLELDSHGVRVPWVISGVHVVQEAEHPWGMGLRVAGFSGRAEEIVWLV